MDELFAATSRALVKHLGSTLTQLGEQWWQRHVVDRLSYQQQRMIAQRRTATLQELDFAALLRVIDQNWHELSKVHELPRDARNWIKELQSVRNRWAHKSADGIPPSEIFRDADTVGKILQALGAPPTDLQLVEASKRSAVQAMSAQDGQETPMATVHERTATDSKAVKETNPAHAISADPAPNPRHLYAKGQVVALRSDPTVLIPILGVDSTSKEVKYSAFYKNAIASFYESQLQSTKPTSSHEVISIEAVRSLLTAKKLLSPSTTGLFSLRLGRINFVSYQYRPVLRLIQADRPRLLVADEVGVGKTIETGLILKELQARMDMKSVVIICPKALVSERKWANEMRRFDESFMPLDGNLLRHCVKEASLDGEWPSQYNKCIVPFSLFDSDLILGKDGKRKTTEAGLVDLDPPPQFDLVIVDEAHHIRNSDTWLHRGIRYFCDNAQAVVFLTATPVQLGSDDLYTLLNVLRPDLVIDKSSFAQMAEPNPFINAAIRNCRTKEPEWESKAADCLETAAKTEWGRLFIRENPKFQGSLDDLRSGSVTDDRRVTIIRDLEELYTFSSLINRTRRRDIGLFATRKPETIRVNFTDGQRELHDKLLGIIARILTRCHGQQSVKFMMTTIRRQAASCLFGLSPLLRDILEGKIDQLEIMESTESEFDEEDTSFIHVIRQDIEELITLATSLDPTDYKADAFMRVVTEKSKLEKNKSLLFTTFRHTLAYLEGKVRDAGLRYGVIHGGIPDHDRAELRRRFSLPKDDALSIDVLLSSEVGCEGLDFQFCDMLINYDLPWNPMRIEQRIGRIDRYGQKSESVAVVNLITRDTVDADIFDRCLERIGVFEHAVGGSEEILGEVSQQIRDIAERFDLTGDERRLRLQQVADNGIRVIKEEEALEEQQAKLFGLNVPGSNWREDIEKASSVWLSPSAIRSCVETYLKSAASGESPQLPNVDAARALRLDVDLRAKLLRDYQSVKGTDEVHRRWERLLKGTVPSLPITFSQDAASKDRDVEHINVLHPLVRQAARHLDRTTVAETHIRIINNDIPPGIHPFAIHHWRYIGVKPDEKIEAISTCSELEMVLPDVIANAASSAKHIETFDQSTLEARHYELWSSARSDHIRVNREIIEQKIHSLSVSSNARRLALEDQLAQATNEKIIKMKQGEIRRANADYEDRMRMLQEALNSGDLQSSPILVGTITVDHSKEA